MIGIHLWEKHVDKMVQKLIDNLDTKKYGENTLFKVDYSLRVIIGETEKIILLCILFGVLGCLKDFLIAFAVIILLRTCTGGIHRKTMLGCFFQTLLNFSLIVFLGEHIMLNKDISVFVVAALVLLSLRFAPIQSENRIHYSEKQRLEFKIKVFVRIIVILLLGEYIPKEQYNVMMFGVLIHTLEMAFLCVRIQKKEVDSNEK